MVLALSADEAYVAIGAAGNNDAVLQAGHVRVFAFADGSWMQVTESADFPVFC